jgi:hypothetical protein
MNIYLILGIVIALSALVYFLFFFKGGAKQYFNRTLIAIDSHKKNLKLPGTSIKKQKLQMSNKNRPMIFRTETGNEEINFGEEANGLLNDMLNKISNKICGKNATKQFPMSNNDYNEVSILLLLFIIKSDKFTNEEKQDYLAVLSLLVNNDFEIKDGSVIIKRDSNKKIAKLFKPDINDITNDVKLSFEDFKMLNYNIIMSFFNIEKYTEMSKVITPNIPIVKIPSEIDSTTPIVSDGLINDVVNIQFITGNKMTEDEKKRFNIYIFNGPEDTNLFKVTDNKSPFEKIYEKINTQNMTDVQKQYVRDIISNLLILNDIEVLDQHIVNTIGDGEPIVINLDGIRQGIEAIKNINYFEMFCELI